MYSKSTWHDEAKQLLLLMYIMHENIMNWTSARSSFGRAGEGKQQPMLLLNFMDSVRLHCDIPAIVSVCARNEKKSIKKLNSLKKYGSVPTERSPTIWLG